MFDTLLESRSSSRRVTGGAIASVSTHAALITAAVLATMQAQTKSGITSEVVRTVYFPPQPPPATRTRAAPGQKHDMPSLPAPIDTRRMNLSVPVIDMKDGPVKPIDFPTAPIGGGGAVDNGSGREPGSNGAFPADQVEKQVALIEGSGAPRYPEVLRRSGVEGRVIALFVVDEDGRAEVDSVRFLRSDNHLFDEAVTTALRRMRFVPAEIGGRKVRQLVQMPFVFTIGR
jgi:protein TonB